MSFPLLTSLYQCAKAFHLTLEALAQQYRASAPDFEQIQGHLETLQGLIKDQWAKLSPEDLPLPLAQSWLPLQTEIQRSWQLLVTDTYFWRTAVQARRPFQYQKRLQGHLQRLQGYGQHLQQLIDQCCSPLE